MSQYPNLWNLHIQTYCSCTFLIFNSIFYIINVKLAWIKNEPVLEKKTTFINRLRRGHNFRSVAFIAQNAELSIKSLVGRKPWKFCI